jgi:hypothetical protein
MRLGDVANGQAATYGDLHLLGTEAASNCVA